MDRAPAEAPAGDPWRWRRQAAVLAGVALLVFAGRCFWVHRAGAQVPVWDQWFAEYGRIYEPLLRDALRLDAVAASHNEHRLFTPRLISILLFLMSGYWDVKGEMVVSAAVRGAEMAVLVLLLGPLIERRRRLGLIAVVLAVGALPFSPLNVLSGFQVQFILVELFSIVALAQVARPLHVERLCGIILCLLLAFFSMATAIVTMGAAVVILLAQGLAGRSLPRPRAAVAGLILGLAAFAIFLTPRYPEYGPPSAMESLRILVRSLTFPFPVVSGWALLGHVPVVILVIRLFRARAADDRAWVVVALAAWTLMLMVSLAVARGATPAPGEQHFDLLALPLIWNYVALARLIDARPPAAPVPRPARAAPALWALGACLALTGLTWFRAVPRLREMEAARPLVESRFRQSLLAHDFRRELTEAQRVDDQVRGGGDGSFVLYDAIGRYTIPKSTLPSLARLERPVARLFPPALSGIGRPALFARLLDGAAAAWPVVLVIGAGLLVAGLRGPFERRQPEERA